VEHQSRHGKRLACRDTTLLVFVRVKCNQGRKVAKWTQTSSMATLWIKKERKMEYILDRVKAIH